MLLIVGFNPLKGISTNVETGVVEQENGAITD